MLIFAACNNSGNDQVAATGEKQQAAIEPGEPLKVDTSVSNVGWFAEKQTGKHDGEFAITDGIVTVKDGEVSGGNFTINISGLEVNDLQGEDKAKLEGHLKSPDFFEVQKFPAAKFEITRIKPVDASSPEKVEGATHIISGNLTLKDSTKNVTFPAKIELTNNAVAAQASFTIDRTDWGLNYKGPNNPQDWFIKKQVGLKLNLVAKKM
jgi:polyisoprenoid-binding protein YceI